MEGEDKQLSGWRNIRGVEITVEVVVRVVMEGLLVKCCRENGGL